MSGRLAGKVCIITGAGSGIGRASTVLFESEGAIVAAADIDTAADGVTELYDVLLESRVLRRRLAGRLEQPR